MRDHYYSHRGAPYRPIGEHPTATLLEALATFDNVVLDHDDGDGASVADLHDRILIELRARELGLCSSPSSPVE